MTQIAGKTAVVTGGGSGIGQALCVQLAASGASVVVADIIADNAEAVAASIRADGGQAVAVTADVCERSSVAALKDGAERAFDRPVQLLFANAGATSFERLTEMPDSDVDWLFQVDLMGVVYCLQAFLPGMIGAGDSHAVATASMSGLLPSWVPCQSCYSSAKMGVIGMMLNLGYELGPHGVRTSVLCPGPTATGMKDNNGRYRPARFGGPGNGPVVLPADFTDSSTQNFNFRPAAEVARMTLLAVQDDFPIIVTDAEDRQYFRSTYVDVVEQAFDRAQAFPLGA